MYTQGASRSQLKLIKRREFWDDWRGERDTEKANEI